MYIHTHARIYIYIYIYRYYYDLLYYTILYYTIKDPSFDKYIITQMPDIMGKDFCLSVGVIHDRNLYTTTNKCLQCLIQIMYTVF